MAITVNTVPANIDNSGAFNVTTSLVEDSTHVNLRLRADIYHEGIIKATLEKPKGIPDFDFADILKSLTPGLLFPRDSGDIVKTGSVGSNLITSWSSDVGTFDTLTTAGAAISSGIKAANASTFAKSNNIAMVPGELYVLYVPTFTTTGATEPYFKFDGTVITQENTNLFLKNKTILIMPTTTGNGVIQIGSYIGQFNFAADVYLYKITTNRSTVGNPLCPYFIKFSEVFEDAVGATTVSGTVSTKVFRNVPAKGDIYAFSTFYVLAGSGNLFANKTLRNNIAKFHTLSPNEYWLQFYTEFADLELFYSKNAGAYDHATHPICYEGWGVIILNVGEIMASVTSTLAIYLKELSGGATISEVLTVIADGSCNNERTVLEFDGLVGGKEYLAFDGLADIEYVTERNYRTGANRNRKPLSFRGLLRQKLETVFKDIANTSYLKSLMVSEDVKRLEPSYATPTEVTIVSDSVSITKGRELFVNQIEIEYAE